MNPVVSIGRQYGSGGTEIGRMLAEMLEVPFYDKEGLKEYAVEHGLGKALLESYGEKHAGSLLVSLSTGAFSFGYFNAAQDSAISQKAYLTAFETVKEVARRGPCVVAGRCADYILRDNPGCFSVFIHAPLEARVARICRRRDTDAGEAEAWIREQDHLRRSFYNYYTRKNWGEVDSYHVTMDSSLFGLKGTAEALLDLLRRDYEGERVPGGRENRREGGY